MIIARTFFATFLPFKISAAILKSDMCPLVHEPITTWSMGISPHSVLVFSGRWGNATVGFSAERSISIVRSYSASGSGS